MAPQKRLGSRKSISYIPPLESDPAIVDKENMGPGSASELMSGDAITFKQKRARSKSLGPGGLNTLQEDAGNRRKAIMATPKSILKPTIPLSPLQEIPVRKLAIPGASGTISSPKSERSANTPPTKSRGVNLSPNKAINASPSKDATATSHNMRSSTGAQTPEKNMEQRRQKQRAEIQKQREARRKSMANRRVSFAPEATLHTFDNLEELQDSTTSSSSTRSTHRMSETSQGMAESPSRSDDDLSSETEQLDDEVGAPTSTPRPRMRRQQRRRSSGIPPMNFNNPDDALSSSPPDAGREDRSETTLRNSDDDESERSFTESHPSASEGVPSTARSPVYPPVGRHVIEQDDEDASMDMTRAIGGVLEGQGSKHASSGTSALEDGTMDLTTAVGGIYQSRNQWQNVDENEDLSVEFTSALGGIQNKRKPGIYQSRGQWQVVDKNEDISMEFTSALGSIQNSRNPGTATQTTERAEEELMAAKVSAPDSDEEADMELTTAVGSIVQNFGLQMGNDGTEEMDFTKPFGSIHASNFHNDISSSTTPQVVAHNSPKSLIGHRRRTTFTSATGSPSVSVQGSITRQHTRDIEPVPANLPVKGVATPPTQMSPAPARPTTPGKTPPINVSMRHPSPRKLFKAELEQAKSSPLYSAAKLMTKDHLAGPLTPKAIATAKSETLSSQPPHGFIGDSWGSPQVAALLDRRSSITEQASKFASQDFQSRTVRFLDPRMLDVEVTREREEDERRESAQFILQHEAENSDDRDATATLRDAIVSMTPSKAQSKARGRKSLAIGSGKGLLGKRPIELDEEEDDSTPRGLKGRESPLKKIRLQAPPSASQTTGRGIRQGLSLLTGNERPQTPTRASPTKRTALTPSHAGYFKDAEALPSAQKPVPVLGQTPDLKEERLSVIEDEHKIGLQDFLNMTNIRFMDLNTTKRRFTAVTAGQRLDVPDGSEVDADTAFEEAVVAGVCTLPLLDLYQHSCRELKKYISEGRKIVRQIEVSTAEENPPLFREYMSASPTDRAMMDDQFKDMKTHARHLSKGMWYEWRMNLLDGLHDGLITEAESLDKDASLLDQQESALGQRLPELTKQHAQLQDELNELQRRAQELANCDQDDLANARQQLASVNQEARARKARLVELQQRCAELDRSVEHAQEAKVEEVQATREAQRVREECRGWTSGEVNTVEAHVRTLESELGWSITGVDSSRLTIVYQGQLELLFDVASFLPASASLRSGQRQNSAIRLSYVADEVTKAPSRFTTEKRFFLQLMRAHLHCIKQHEVHVRDLLTFVSTTWSQGLALSSEIQRLDAERITHCDIRSDEMLVVRTMLLVPGAATKVNVNFEINAVAKDMAVEAKLKTAVDVAYGEQYKQDKMRDFLTTRIGYHLVSGKAKWADAVTELWQKLAQRASK